MHGNTRPSGYWIMMVSYTLFLILNFSQNFKDKIFEIKHKPQNPWKLDFTEFSGILMWLTLLNTFMTSACPPECIANSAYDVLSIGVCGVCYSWIISLIIVIINNLQMVSYK